MNLKNAIGAATKRHKRHKIMAQLTWKFHTFFVAQTSQSAVSRVSKPAWRLTVSTPCRLGSRRHNRLGNLRYWAGVPLALEVCEICGLKEKCEEWFTFLGEGERSEPALRRANFFEPFVLFCGHFNCGILGETMVTPNMKNTRMKEMPGSILCVALLVSLAVAIRVPGQRSLDRPGEQEAVAASLARGQFAARDESRRGAGEGFQTGDVPHAATFVRHAFAGKRI